MTLSSPLTELDELANAQCEGVLTDLQAARVEELVTDNAQLRRHYIVYLQIHALAERNREIAGEDATVGGLTKEDIGKLAISFPASSTAVSFQPPSINDVPHGFFSTALHGTISYFSQEIPFSLLIATVVTGLGLLLGSMIYVSGPEHIAKRSSPVPTAIDPRLEIVGQISGMFDVKWEEGSRTKDQGSTSAHHSTEVINQKAPVALGDKFTLTSGLLEITYDTGAKVLLQGPITYEVDSRTGGFLSIGKLTAKLEKKGDGRDGKKLDSNPQSLISDPALSTIHDPLFTIKTPTATVTDLGTEFGVEVDMRGCTTSHVFRGKVELRVTGDKGSQKPILLGENESIRVEYGQDRVPVVRRDTVSANKFTRRLSRLKRMPIAVFNTGVGLKEGQPDPHWQIVAVDKVPNFKPRAALVTSIHPIWLANAPDKSQWISVSADWRVKDMPDDCIYTYRTTFELENTRPSTAEIHGCFIVDDTVQAIRLNGRSVPVTKNISYKDFWWFTIDRGFVDGANVLEFDVHDIGNSTGLRVELKGEVLQETTDEMP